MMTLHEQYLLAPACYVDLNPVKAKLVKRAEEYPWSSAAAHLNGENDILVNVEPISAMVGDWKQFLWSSSDNELDAIRKHERTGRPLGVDNFLSLLEEKSGRILKNRSQAPKRTIIR